MSGAEAGGDRAPVADGAAAAWASDEEERPGGRRRRREREGSPPPVHDGSSYYGQPIINPPVWKELDIAGYLFLGGLAGASSILASGAELTGRPTLARRSKLCATGAIGLSLLALINDLGRPARFLNMLRVFKPTSPMSVGVWLLGAYVPLSAATSASDLTGIARPAGRAAGVGAALAGAGVSSYTAALIANTAVPVWHGARRELPFVFVGSAAGAAAGFGLLAAPPAQTGPARRMAALGVATELIAGQVMEQRLGMIAGALHDGTAGRRLGAAKALSAAGALGGLTVARRSRVAAIASGAALMAGSALTRFAIFAAGMASAGDPKYTVTPQRQRLAARPAEQPAG